MLIWGKCDRIMYWYLNENINKDVSYPIIHIYRKYILPLKNEKKYQYGRYFYLNKYAQKI